jgi:hypothetical protein
MRHNLVSAYFLFSLRGFPKVIGGNLVTAMFPSTSIGFSMSTLRGLSITSVIGLSVIKFTLIGQPVKVKTNNISVAFAVKESQRNVFI